MSRKIGLLLSLVIPIFLFSLPTNSAEAETAELEFVSQILNYAYDVDVEGNSVYVATGGLTIIDASNPSSPTETGSYGIPTCGLISVDANGPYAYVTQMASFCYIDGVRVRDSIHVVDVSEPSIPTEIGFLNITGTGGAWEIDESNTYAYVAFRQGGLLVLDVADPSNPNVVGHYNPGADFTDLKVVGNTAYLAAIDGNLWIVDVSDTANPFLISSYHPPAAGNALGVAVQGNYAYLALGSFGLRIIDISNSTTPNEVGFIHWREVPGWNGYAVDVEVGDGFAFLADSGEGVRAVDVSDPTNPTEVSFYNHRGSGAVASRLAISGQHIFVADGSGGLVILKFEDIGSGGQLEVLVEPVGNFCFLDDNNEISTLCEGYSTLAYRVHVSDGGIPVEGAHVTVVSPYWGPQGTTDSSGNLDSILILPSPSPDTVGEFDITVEVTAGGQTISSGAVKLFTSQFLQPRIVMTLTEDEASSYPDILLWNYLVRPGLDSITDVHVWGAPLLYDYLATGASIIQIMAALREVSDGLADYSPQAGDVIGVEGYNYTTEEGITGYAYREYVLRADSLIYDYSTWTTQVDLVNSVLNPPNRRGISGVLASPTTAVVIAPAGERAGYDPSAGEHIFDFQLAISEPGDEPYYFVIPDPTAGEYILQVVGTGAGPYSLAIGALDGTGNAAEAIQVNGLVELGSVTDFAVHYQISNSGTVSLELTRIVEIDIKPGSEPNCFNNNGHGVIPVAIISDSIFDATRVVPSTIQLDGQVVRSVGRGNTQAHFEDVNNDGLLDLMVQIEDIAGTYQSGVAIAKLTGTTLEGLRIRGEDSVCIVP